MGCSTKSRAPALGDTNPSSNLKGADVDLRSSDGGADATLVAVRALFVGNSHTDALMGDLRRMIAWGAAGTVVDAITAGGAFLRDHASHAQTLNRIRSEGWNVVVLQEQQVVAALPQAERDVDFLPPLKILVDAATSGGAKPMLLMTYARKNGDDVSGFFPNDSYDAMQARQLQGYREASDATGAPRIPVAYAWDQARLELPTLELYQTDGTHPSADGAHLAAAVAYVSVTSHDPTQLVFPEEDPTSSRPHLRKIAAATLLPR